MKKQYDFKKEWEQTKKQLIKFSKEAAVVAKKGEEEIVKFTQKSKLHIDATSLSLKKEHLFYLIGKEYVKQVQSKKSSAKLKKLLAELKQASDDQKTIKTKLSGTKKEGSKRKKK